MRDDLDEMKLAVLDAPMTVEQFRGLHGVAESTARAWLSDLESRGLVRRAGRMRRAGSGGGRPPDLYVRVEVGDE